jgi:hypothetical protein
MPRFLQSVRQRPWIAAVLGRATSRAVNQHCRMRLKPPTGRRVQPILEMLEDRTLPSVTTFIVDSPGDAGVGSGTSGDIRYCINQANGLTNGGATID